LTFVGIPVAIMMLAIMSHRNTVDRKSVDYISIKVDQAEATIRSADDATEDDNFENLKSDLMNYKI
jgi:hypothetical protein